MLRCAFDWSGIQSLAAGLLLVAPNKLSARQTFAHFRIYTFSCFRTYIHRLLGPDAGNNCPGSSGRLGVLDRRPACWPAQAWIISLYITLMGRSGPRQARDGLVRPLGRVAVGHPGCKVSGRSCRLQSPYIAVLEAFVCVANVCLSGSCVCRADLPALATNGFARAVRIWLSQGARRAGQLVDYASYFDVCVCVHETAAAAAPLGGEQGQAGWRLDWPASRLLLLLDAAALACMQA